MREKNSEKTKRYVFWILLIIYILAVLWVTLLSRKPHDESAVILPPMFLRRLFTIDFAPDGAVAGIRIGQIYRQSWENILLFIPLGFLLPQVADFARKFWPMMLVGFGFSAAIEITQLITRLGWLDVDDLLLNLVGTAMGFWVYKAAKRIAQ